MEKAEKLLSIKKTLSEVRQQATIVFCSSKGPETPHAETVEIQEYTIEFSTPHRGLLFDADIVKKALEENLEGITRSVKFLAQQALYQTEKDALIEAEENLVFIKKEIRHDVSV